MQKRYRVTLTDSEWEEPGSLRRFVVRLSGGLIRSVDWFGAENGGVRCLRSGTILQATIPDGRQVKVGGRSLQIPWALVASLLSAGPPPRVRNRKKGTMP
jgi:hypothetical protein